MRVLIVGANYGLLLAGMMLERNIQVDVFGTENQVKVLNEEGFTINSNEKNWKFRPSNNWDGINSVQNKNYDLVYGSLLTSFHGENNKPILFKK